MFNRHSKSTLPLAAVAFGALLLTGCGGGGSTSSVTNPPPVTGGSGQDQSFGLLKAHVVGTLQPPVISSTDSLVVTGVAGATISNLVLTQTASLSNTKIAFTRDTNVYTMSPDGSNVTALTNDLSTNGFTVPHPTWGQGAYSLVFSTYNQPASYVNLYSVNTNGTGEHLLFSDSVDDSNPAASFDGSKIAFSRYDTVSNHYQIFVINADGTNLHRVSNGTANDSSASWSPSGSQLVFEHLDPTTNYYQLYIINADGTNMHKAYTASTYFGSSNMQYPVWSPDGNQIAFSWYDGTHSHIYVVNVAGTLSHSVTTDAMDDAYPTWSPDSKKIAFTRHDTLVNKDQIYVTDITGATKTRLSDGTINDTTPSWSPLPTARILIGSGGSLGSASAGFLFGQQGDAVTSILTFDATTRNGVTITPQSNTSPNQPNLIFTLASSDSLTSLSYVNDVFTQAAFRPIGVGRPVTSATNALISFTSSSGHVASVIPYVSNHAVIGSGPKPRTSLVSHAEGSVQVFEGKFLGAWDGNGKNIAPDGASEVRINSRTGQLISVK